MSTASDQIPIEIDVCTVKSLLDANADFLLLDVRERAEHNFVHIPEAELVPMSQIQNRIIELEPYRKKHIVVHCHLGGRSFQVTEWLRALGFAKVQNMTGGIEAWSEEIDPSLPRYQ
jgi:rhodanese-related sulfurtransferase